MFVGDPQCCVRSVGPKLWQKQDAQRARPHRLTPTKLPHWIDRIGARFDPVLPKCWFKLGLSKVGRVFRAPAVVAEPGQLMHWSGCRARAAYALEWLPSPGSLYPEWPLCSASLLHTFVVEAAWQLGAVTGMRGPGRRRSRPDCM